MGVVAAEVKYQCRNVFLIECIIIANRVRNSGVNTSSNLIIDLSSTYTIPLVW